MTATTRTLPQVWVVRADEARRMEQITANPRMKGLLREIANSYDLLALIEVERMFVVDEDAKP